MNSFYGGKQGRTYNIVARFNSITEMQELFRRGAAYTAVSYGLYVLIDTIIENNNPNDPDNGKIYRRGLNYSADDGGAIYVGQIQGPEGKIPPLNITDFSNYSTTVESTATITIDGPETISPPTTLKAWDGSTYHPIKIGYATIADKNGSNRKGIIGLDLPQPVIGLNSSIVSTGNFNLIEQTTASINATSNGAQYYAYDIKFPVVSNFKILRAIDATTKADPDTYTLEYNAPTSGASGSFETKSTTLPINVVDKMRWQGDLIQYRTTQDGWKDLYNPNGQFHIYAEINNITTETTTYSSSNAIDYLNTSTQYKYGIRTPLSDGTYDITQAGWVLSVELKDNSTSGVYSALFAYDYTPTTESSSYTLEDFKKQQIPNTIKPKGWFKVQSFESSLASDPEQIFVVGKQGEDQMDVKPTDLNNLKNHGIWAYAEKEEAIKWWI